MKTLNEALERAATFPECGLRLLDRREQETWLSWSEILNRSTVVAGGLQSAGVREGDIVGLFYLTGQEFFSAFFGVLLAGAVPAPLYPPMRLGRLSEYRLRTARMLRAAGVRRALTDGRLRRILGEALDQADCRGYTLEELPDGAPMASVVQPDALGLVQFSSGTTKDPKPVALTHQALMAQARALNGFWPDTEERRHSGVSWLPLYHDMGLIGCVVTVLERPSIQTLIPPELFVARPAVWLRTLSRFAATVSPAPTFAYALCVEKIRDEELQGVDLGEWRIALCGAETVVPSVLQRFAERFEPFGFRSEALTPVYGLSEAALAVTFSDLDRCLTSRPLPRSVGKATVGNGREVVSVGRPLPGFEIQIRDEKGLEQGDEREGEVWVRGPSLMREYLNQPQATRAVLKDGWLNTGDLGFVYRHELYVTGRAKDVLIVRGANHAPDEIEAAVSELDQVRTGCAAAVGYLPQTGDREEVWLFVEPSRGWRHAERGDLEEVCRHQVLAHTGIAIDRLEVLEPRTLPRTSSGKIRRRRTLELFLAGELETPEPVSPARVVQAKGRSVRARLRQPEGDDAG